MQKGSTETLPVDAALPDIRQALAHRRAVVVTAAPGAGKTTRVPPALIDEGRVLLLQPRRVAARAIARRIASERGWNAGREVGWHVRFDRRETAETRLLVATEGVLTARLQRDPLLSDFRTIILDEFHERSIHSDLGLALGRQAWLARDDLRIVVMSATLDASAVSAFLGDCPVIAVPGRLHPVDISYRPGAEADDVLSDERARLEGAALVFLPGVREIRHAADRIAARLEGTPVFELHGSLDADRQDAVLVPGGAPRVILATNIAETTVTVPDVRLVVDAGWQKVPRYDAARGVDALVTERISRDAADQRAGRAGRVAPGRAVRLWDEHARLRTHRDAEITRVDLAGPALEILAWGADPRTFEWFEAPRADMLQAALRLLERLGACEGGRLTELGRLMQRLPLHPRLSRMLIEAEGALDMARGVAVLSERLDWPASAAASTCDLHGVVERLDAPAVRNQSRLPIDRVARDLQAAFRRATGRAPRPRLGERDFRRAVFTGYVDRVARRRGSGSNRFLLASGTGGRLASESGVINHEFIVALDVRAAEGADSTIRAATAIEDDWITPTAVEVRHRLDRDAGVVRAAGVDLYDAIVLRSVETTVDPLEAASLIEAALLDRGPGPEERQLLARARAAGVDLSFETLAHDAAQVPTRLADVDVAAFVPREHRQLIEQYAPASLPLPSGRHARLDYRDDGRVVAAVKLQELFGLAETPRVGRQPTPVLFELLAPNGRPVQVTSDLRSFWTTGYQQVRRELRARYPRHPWPEDPWTAQATHRTVKRS